MKSISIQPLLNAFSRAKQSTIVTASRAVSIDEILISTDLRRGLVATIFVVSDSALKATDMRTRQDVEGMLLKQVRLELGTLDRSQLPDGVPDGVHNVNWLSREDLQRDYGGSYDRYLRA